MEPTTISNARPQTNSDSSDGFPTGLFVRLDRSRPPGVRLKLEEALRETIQQGRLRGGAKLPPSRTLATELGIARSVVVQAYGQLGAEGYLEAVQGAGTRVCAGVSIDQPRPASAAPPLNMAFTTGLPDPAFFPRRDWMRAYRSALSESADVALGFPDPQGRIELRSSLADYLARVRSVRAQPEQLLITNGVSQGLMVACRALHDRGTRRIAVEDPCFALHRLLIASCGIEPVPVPVDEHGMAVEALTDARVSAVLVAPAHSYPRGSVLSPERRVALLEWATRRDALIIEDDYDAEFRFDRTPIGALQSLAPENVVYAGGVSKALNAALRLGWMAAPQRLIHDLIGAKSVYDIATESLSQLALARFIDAGSLARHIRRVRPRYRARRDALLESLAAAAPELEPLGAAAGLHLFIPLPAGAREGDVVARAKEDGLRIEGAAKHWADPPAAAPAVLVGYGLLREATVDADVGALVSAIRAGERRNGRPAHARGSR